MPSEHSDFYKHNRAYSEKLRDRDPREFQGLPTLCASASFYQKYADALSAGRHGGSAIVDVGCGVGQVARSLAEAGLYAHGIDVSEESIALAKEHAGVFQMFDGKVIPFPDAFADSIGAFNVLEHVEEPVRLLDEMLRVLKPGGRMVVSSPNFLRVFGLKDYHPHMRGVGSKLRNFSTIRQHARAYAADPKLVLFKKLAPIDREPAQPDDDAIVATSAIDLRQYFRARGMKNIKVSCVDRPIPAWMETLLDLTPLRLLILNCFITGEKP